jgi:hypothetical protein
MTASVDGQTLDTGTSTFSILTNLSSYGSLLGNQLVYPDSNHYLELSSNIG